MEYPTDEEYALINKVVLMPFVLRDINDDKEVIRRIESFRGNYVPLLEILHDKAHSDVIDARKELQRLKTNVYSTSKDNDGVKFKYKVRGWEHSGAYGWGIAEVYIKQLLQSYIED